MDVVIGASGDLGGRLVDRLLEGGGAVRATSRDPDTRLVEARDRGAETVRLDVREPETVTQAIRGARRIVLASQALYPPDRHNNPETADVEGNRRVIDAASVAGIEHIVFASVAGPAPDAPAKWWQVKHDTETYLRESGVPHTCVRYAGLFVESHCLLLLGEPVREGKRVQLFSPPENPVRWLAADDAADYIFDVLADPPPSAASTPTVTGTDVKSRAEVLEIIERALGRTARTVQLPLPMLRAMRTLTKPTHLGMHYLVDLTVAEHDNPDFIGWSPSAGDADHIGPTTVEDVVGRWAGATA